MVAALAAILPAICEEFLFRGVLFNAFLLVFNKEKYDILWTSIVCSILFGLVLSYLRVWSNGLIWGMIVHFLQDFSPKILNTDYGTSKIKLAILGVIPVVILMLICIYTINRRFLKIK